MVKKTLSKRCEEYIEEIKNKDIEIKELKNLIKQHELTIDEKRGENLASLHDIVFDSSDSSDSSDSEDEKQFQKQKQMYMDSYKYETGKFLKANIDKPGVLDVINKIKDKKGYNLKNAIKK